MRWIGPRWCNLLQKIENTKSILYQLAIGLEEEWLIDLKDFGEGLWLLLQKTRKYITLEIQDTARFLKKSAKSLAKLI